MRVQLRFINRFPVFVKARQLGALVHGYRRSSGWTDEVPVGERSVGNKEKALQRNETKSYACLTVFEGGNWRECSTLVAAVLDFLEIRGKRFAGRYSEGYCIVVRFAELLQWRLLHCFEVIRAVTVNATALLWGLQGYYSEGYCIVARLSGR
jgi:hypothetical protein